MDKSNQNLEKGHAVYLQNLEVGHKAHHTATASTGWGKKGEKSWFFDIIQLKVCNLYRPVTAHH